VDPLFWFVDVVFLPPDRGTRNLFWKLRVRFQNIVERGMLARGTYTVWEDIAGCMFVQNSWDHCEYRCIVTEKSLALPQVVDFKVFGGGGDLRTSLHNT
jgi:hypothetical protein